MSRIIIYRERDRNEPLPFEVKVLDALMAKEFPGVQVLDAANMREFLRHIQQDHKVVIFDWSGHQSPTQVMEAYYQSQFGRALFVSYYKHFKRGEKKFLEEYNSQEYVVVKEPKRELGYADVIKKVREVMEQKLPIIKLRKAQIGIHYFIYNEKYDKAAKLYAKLEGALPDPDKVFYSALFMKAQGNFEGAIEEIKANPSPSAKMLGLYGTLLHHAKQYKPALVYLQKAQEISHLNMRRNFLIAKVYEQLVSEDSKYRAKAMTAYLELYKLAPTYGGVTGKIVSLVMDSESIEHIPIMASLLEQVPHRELMRIYKKIDKFDEPFRSAFKDVLISAMSKIANRMIQEDDLTALKYYKYIAKMLPKTDDRRRQTLDYCLARAYFRFGQLDLADQICTEVVEQTNGEYDKAVALGKLIKKALNGEFDVLLDDEKDWLIQTKSA